jgi:hypothetical protein
MGKTFYIISDPKDVAAIFKNTKTLTFVGFIEDVMINGWEAPREFVERIKLPSEGGELFYKDPSLFTNTHEWYHEFLVNGSNLSLLTSRMLDGLVDNMETKYKFPGLESLNRNNTVDLGLYTWMFHYLGTSMTNVLYGPAFMALCPDFMTILRDFDGMAWKIFYMYPKFLTTEAHSAKYYMLDAMERYYVAWSKSEAIQKDASDFFNKRIKMMYAANCTAREIAYHTLGVLFACVSMIPLGVFTNVLVSFTEHTPIQPKRQLGHFYIFSQLLVWHPGFAPKPRKHFRAIRPPAESHLSAI